MFKTALNALSPIFAAATLQPGGGNLYGIGSNQLGMALLIIMALAVIANQLWTLFDKARRAIRSPEVSTTGLASLELCERRHNEIERSMASLKAENDRQDRLNREQYQTVTVALGELKHEMREDIKGLHKRSDDVLRAVSRLEGKVS